MKYISHSLLIGDCNISFDDLQVKLETLFLYYKGEVICSIEYSLVKGKFRILHQYVASNGKMNTYTVE